MDINLGTIQIQPKGAWESTVAYEYLNLIRYNNNSYICRSKIGAPTGTRQHAKPLHHTGKPIPHRANGKQNPKHPRHRPANRRSPQTIQQRFCRTLRKILRSTRWLSQTRHLRRLHTRQHLHRRQRTLNTANLNIRRPEKWT